MAREKGELKSFLSSNCATCTILFLCYFVRRIVSVDSENSGEKVKGIKTKIGA